MSKKEVGQAEVIIVKLESLRELTEEKFRGIEQHNIDTNAHLADLNGKVAKNTEWRFKLMGVIAAVSALLSILYNLI